MRYSLVFREDQIDALTSLFRRADGHERAAYAVCSKAELESETRVLVSEVVHVQEQDIQESSPQHISILSRSYVPVLARCERQKQSFFLVHSHPGGFPEFSQQDDQEEAALFRTAFDRAPQGPHGSIIFVGTEKPSLLGRAWVTERSHEPLTRITVAGRRLRFFEQDVTPDEQIPPWADRQVRVFGPEFQKTVARLHVAVVGAGGTGSCVAEQLIRLGVGQITVVDEQRLTATNATRVYGSSLKDTNEWKVDLVERSAKHIDLQTVVTPIRGSVAEEETAGLLRGCDVIFGCTDDTFGRIVLNKLALYYYVPVIDCAVTVDAEEHLLRGVFGRVTNLYPGSTCLRCRGRISEDILRAETLRRSSPAEYEQQVREGYIPSLDTPDPSVVMFTTAVAARAVNEFVHMITGYMGEDRRTTEVQELFHDTYVGRNSAGGRDGCICQTPRKWGKGDRSKFLDLIW